MDERNKTIEYCVLLKIHVVQLGLLFLGESVGCSAHCFKM